MVQVTVEQALDLPQLLERVRQGEEFIIVQDDAPLARLSPVLLPREPGSAVGIITYVAEDFDAPLDEGVYVYEGVNTLAQKCFVSWSQADVSQLSRASGLGSQGGSLNSRKSAREWTYGS